MRKAWFCYQLGSKHPVPCIIYDNLPDDAASKSSLKPNLVQIHELTEPKWFTDYDGEKVLDEVTASFNVLSQYYPYTGNIYDVDPKINIDHRQDILLQVTSAMMSELGPSELR